MKNTNSRTGSKYILLFGILFSGLVFISMVYEWVSPSGGWLRGFNNAWVDFRINAPKYLSAVGSGESDGYNYSFGGLINKPGDPRIVIAAVDIHTLQTLGYPFPRKYYGQMIEKLNKLGAKVIVMDVFTVNPDRAGYASDRAYVEAVAKAGNVSSIINFDRVNMKFELPIKGLAEASKYLSIPNMDKAIGRDNNVRKVYLFDSDVTYDGVPGLKMKCPETECGQLGLSGLAPVAYAGYKDMKLNEVFEKFGGESLSLNFRYPRERKANPGWSKDGSITYSLYRWISVKDIIDGKLSKEEKEAIKGGIIMVGSTATGAYDHYPSPFFPNMPGVEIHANALDNMLNEDFLKPFNHLLLTITLLIAVWLPIKLRSYSISIIAAVVGVVLAVLLVLDIYLLHKMYDFAFGYIALCIGVPFVFVTVHKALVEGQEKKWIKNTFGQYLSPKVVEVITKDPSKLTLGGEKREMTVFFLDIAGFTTMSERLTPDQLTKMMNIYLSGLTDVILKHDGVVDKFIGDCIMAFWNAPLDQKDHRRLACLSAVDCVAEMRRLNESPEFSIKPSCRIGLNTGPMVVGNMGSSTRFSYTVMGDAVNLASRLEGANKYFHSSVMVSGETFEEARDLLEARYLGSIRVVGKAIPVKVYEPFARKGEASSGIMDMLKHYNVGQDKFYKANYSGSIKDFQAALAALPGDGPTQFYLELAEKYAKEPPKDWDGSFNLTSK